ncbi:MAG TPA: fused MFS/spermidine synthase [Polyangiaceae bacterium]
MTTADVPMELEARRSTSPPRTVLPFGAVVVLFVLSGAAGLVDQVCFSKYLSYVVGATAYAVSAVLAAFMTGLALGAYLGGKVSERIRRPLFAYGVLEVVVAVAVAITPLEFEALTELYAALARRAPDSLALLTVLRWFVALAIVIVPTTAMGATLPILTRALGAGGAASRERQLGALYAANTSGGAIGALLAAYLLLPALGLRGSLVLGAVVSAVVGVVALVIGREVTPVEDRAESAHEVTRSEPQGVEVPLLVGLAFLSGCLVFAAEVVFTHLLALLIGNSAYAFGLILAVFLCCLFVGAARAGWLRAKLGEGALGLGLAASALALAGTLPVWDRLPYLFAALGKHVTTFGGREAVRAFAAFAVLCVPTMLMGLTFPLLLQRVAGLSSASRWVGKLTAVNTIGAVAGALGTGYVLVPWLGSEHSVRAVALAFALTALATAGWAVGTLRRQVVGLSAGAALAAVLLPGWDLARLTGGSNVYFERWQEPEQIPFLREDVHGGVTSVARAGGVLTLYTNGKFQGNTGWEMSAQRFFAHYPSLFVDRFERSLVIGLGTGTTLGTLAAYPWKRIDVVEISPQIVAAARQYFQVGNRGSIDDPRVTLHHADGRNFVLVDDGKYDLISMELSSIWFAGASNLYSREFYRLARERLAPGGVFQQWVQLHHVYPRDFATIVGTLHGEFRHVALFYGGGQGILVASDEPLRASKSRLAALEARPEFQGVLSDDRHLVQLTDDILALDDGLDRFLAKSAEEAGLDRADLVSTDHSLYLEYATPRGNVLPWETRDALVRDIWRFRDENAIAALLVP